MIDFELSQWVTIKKKISFVALILNGNKTIGSCAKGALHLATVPEKRISSRLLATKISLRLKTFNGATIKVLADVQILPLIILSS